MRIRKSGVVFPGPRRAHAVGLVGLGIAHILCSLTAKADDAVSTTQKNEQEVEEVKVTAPRDNPAVAAAPVRGVLTETEPEAVITRKFIEEASPRVGDFSTIAVLAPSMVSTPQPNGPGLSDGGKISMRGFSDGNYNITYDGVAWGDTNGPSHHGTAFFPNSTIGGVIIDRGPGRAGDFGPANFGGSVNLKSLPLEDTPAFTQVLTNGSWNTWQSVSTIQSGKIDELHGARFLANFQEMRSNGYLTNNGTNGSVQMVKSAVPVTDTLTLTALATHTKYFYNKSDIGDAVISDLEKYGQNFSLSADPSQQNYYGYNWATKDTHFEYVKLDGEIGAGFGIDNTVYNYGYDNNTSSGESQISNARNVVTPGAGLAGDIGPSYPCLSSTACLPDAAYPAPGKTYPASLQVEGIPGYLKKNQYQVTGDMLRLSYTVPFGTLSFGTNYEGSASYRYIVDVNLLNGQPDYREKAASAAGPSAPYQQTPLDLQYIEYSGWRQYQPFVELEWRPTGRLTISPGAKYVHWDLYLNAPVAEKLPNGAQPLVFDEIFTRTIPFFAANYRIEDNWSVYFQYAQGFLIPNIGNFYVDNLASSKVVPQLSTNYQLGTVFTLSHFTFDGDVYWIDFQHKIQQYVDADNQPYETNSGGATYKGVEVQGTYSFPYGLGVFANGSYNSAIGKDDKSNPLYDGHQLTGAPVWTAAAGLRFEHDALFTSADSTILFLADKFVGNQYVNNASCSTVNANGVCQIGPKTVLTPVLGLLPSYSEADLSLTYRVGYFSIEAQILNLLDHDSLTSMKGKAYLPNSSEFALTSAQGGGANAPEFQVPRSYQLTFKVKI
jgi:iron complex outermembrane recepter protein